jgi:predicted transglutaminase-like cysteine proteinase
MTGSLSAGQNIEVEDSWNTALESSSTPEDLSGHIKRQVRYRSDKREYWQTGRETWERRRGDCEDFAILMVQMCREKGFSAQMMCYAAGRKGHAIAVGMWEGRYWILNNGIFTTVDHPSEIESLMASHLNSPVSHLRKFVVGDRAMEHELNNRARS